MSKFKSFVETVIWDPVLKENGSNNFYNIFICVLRNHFGRSFPLVKANKHRRLDNPGCQPLKRIRESNKLYNKLLKTRNISILTLLSRRERTKI